MNKGKIKRSASAKTIKICSVYVQMYAPHAAGVFCRWTQSSHTLSDVFTALICTLISLHAKLLTLIQQLTRVSRPAGSSVVLC